MQVDSLYDEQLLGSLDRFWEAVTDSASGSVVTPSAFTMPSFACVSAPSSTHTTSSASTSGRYCSAGVLLGTDLPATTFSSDSLFASNPFCYQEPHDSGLLQQKRCLERGDDERSERFVTTSLSKQLAELSTAHEHDELRSDPLIADNGTQTAENADDVFGLRNSAAELWSAEENTFDGTAMLLEEEEEEEADDELDDEASSEHPHPLRSSCSLFDARQQQLAEYASQRGGLYVELPALLPETTECLRTTSSSSSSFSSASNSSARHSSFSAPSSTATVATSSCATATASCSSSSSSSSSPSASLFPSSSPYSLLRHTAGSVYRPAVGSARAPQCHTSSNRSAALSPQQCREDSTRCELERERMLQSLGLLDDSMVSPLLDSEELLFQDLPATALPHHSAAVVSSRQDAISNASSLLNNSSQHNSSCSPSSFAGSFSSVTSTSANSTDSSSASSSSVSSAMSRHSAACSPLGAVPITEVKLESDRLQEHLLAARQDAAAECERQRLHQQLQYEAAKQQQERRRRRRNSAAESPSDAELLRQADLQVRQLNERGETIVGQVRSVCESLRQLPVNSLGGEPLQSVAAQLQQILHSCNELHTQVEALLDQTVLSPTQLVPLKRLTKQMGICRRQTTLLLHELAWRNDPQEKHRQQHFATFSSFSTTTTTTTTTATATAASPSSLSSSAAASHSSVAATPSSFGVAASPGSPGSPGSPSSPGFSSSPVSPASSSFSLSASGSSGEVQSVAPALATLTIVEQPFPASYLKGSPIREALRVVVLKGAHVDIQVVGEVVASVVHSQGQRIALKNHTCALDPDGVADFQELSFDASCRLQMVRLQFHLEVLQDGVRRTLSSELSEPVIVLANQPAQWADAERSLLIQQAFHRQEQDLLHVSWPRFMNSLQYRMERICRSWARPFSLCEQQWIRRRLCAAGGVISRSDVESFWRWFGQNFKLLRDPRKNLPMWLGGMVYPFIGKEDCAVALRDRPVGSFLVRFSSTRPGRFGLAVVTAQGGVAHYLLNSEDNKKKLADFLSTFPPADRCLRVEVDPHSAQQQFQLIAKKELISNFGSKSRRCRNSFTNRSLDKQEGYNVF